LKNNAKHKYGGRNTVTRYSLLQEDHKKDDVIITKMKNRLLKINGNNAECFAGDYNKVLFCQNNGSQNPPIIETEEA
jgi:hypothetical protein